MDQQGHNEPLPPFDGLPYLLDFDMYPYPEQEAHQPQGPQPQPQPQPQRSYWADQYREMEETSNFRRQRLPLNGIVQIMMADEDVKMITRETPVIFERACEMFIIELAHKGWAHAQERNRVTIEKEDIIAALNQTDYCDFLADIGTTEEPKEEDDFDPMKQIAPGPAAA